MVNHLLVLVTELNEISEYAAVNHSFDLQKLNKEYSLEGTFKKQNKVA